MGYVPQKKITIRKSPYIFRTIKAYRDTNLYSPDITLIIEIFLLFFFCEVFSIRVYFLRRFANSSPHSKTIKNNRSALNLILYNIYNFIKYVWKVEQTNVVRCIGQVNLMDENTAFINNTWWLITHGYNFPYT